MDASCFYQFIKALTLGKHIGNATYLHQSTLETIDKKLADFIYLIAKALDISQSKWNIVKLHKNQFRISYLNYPKFYQDAYPSLESSITVDLENKTRKDATYSETENAPILHRKELLIHPENEFYDEFCAITQEGETAGLYENSRIIGFKNSWERIIKRHGYALVDNRLFRLSAVPDSNNECQETIDRHKTAIQRQELSAPMKALAKHGYLNGDYTVFDYGCGLGDDLRELEAHGIDAAGWDPSFRPEVERFTCDLVNLGFVINVIEDREERIEAVQLAYELTGKLFVVSAMIAGDSHIQKFKPYKDGVITSLNTFQKYFSQSELQGFIENTLDENAIAVGPGIFFVFKEKIEEQLFLSARQQRHYNWKQITTRPISKQERLEIIINENEQLFENFWKSCLILGRIPANEEFEESGEARNLIGSHKKIFSVLRNYYDIDEFDKAEQFRKDDLMVYFALSQFGKRKPYTKLPDKLQRDLKAFFGNYNTAIETARELLFSIANPDLIHDACLNAHQDLPASVLDEDHSLIFHKDFLELLPPILRVYVGCGTQLCGELEDINLIKVHIQSGKVSFMGYEEFDDSPLPLLKERIKVKLKEQDTDFFDYVDKFKPRPLYWKSKYLSQDQANFIKQTSFDNRLNKLNIVPLVNDYGIPFTELELKLKSIGLKMKGYKFYKI